MCLPFCPWCALRRIEDRLTELECKMSEMGDNLTALTAVVEDVKADFQAFKDAVENSSGQLPADVQPAYEKLAASLGDLDAAVGDADGSDGGIPQPPVG